MKTERYLREALWNVVSNPQATAEQRAWARTQLAYFANLDKERLANGESWVRLCEDLRS